MIQLRLVNIQTVSTCVEKNNTFARSITRYSGLKVCDERSHRPTNCCKNPERMASNSVRDYRHKAGF